MKSGYDQFFKTAQKVADTGRAPKINLRKPLRADFKSDSPPLVGRKVQTQDSKILAHQLRESMRPRIQKKKKKSGISWKLVGFSLMGLLITFAGLYKMDDVEKLAKTIEFSLIGVAAAEEVTPKTTEAAKPGVKVAGKDAKDVNEVEAQVMKKDFSEEEISHFGKLNERKRELDAREEELNRMEQELAVQKTDLEKRLTELESTRRNISSVLDEKVQGDDKKVENLVQMYSNMKPQHAAKAFEDMDENLAIEILGRMKKKNAAEIMNLVKSEKVKILSEKYAGYRRN